MTIICFRNLIDMAIGSPEAGNVNFNALHCLLHVMADKLKLNDELIDIETLSYPMNLNAGGTSHSIDVSHVCCKNKMQQIQGNTDDSQQQGDTSEHYGNEMDSSTGKTEVIEVPVHMARCNVTYPMEGQARMVVYPTQVAYATEQVLLEYTEPSDATAIVPVGGGDTSEIKSNSCNHDERSENSTANRQKIGAFCVKGNLKEKLEKFMASKSDKFSESIRSDLDDSGDSGPLLQGSVKEVNPLSQQVASKLKSDGTGDGKQRENLVFTGIGDWVGYEQKGYMDSGYREQVKYVTSTENWPNVNTNYNVLTVQTNEPAEMNIKEEEIEKIVEKHLEELKEKIDAIQSDSQNIVVLSIELSSLKETINSLNGSFDQMKVKLAQATDVSRREEFPSYLEEYLEQKLQSVFRKFDDIKFTLKGQEEKINCIAASKKTTAIQPSPAPISTEPRTSTKASEIAEALRVTVAELSSNYDMLVRQQTYQSDSITKIQDTIKDMHKRILEKDEIDDLLSEKADYTLLYRKASVEKMDANRRELEKKINELSASLELLECRMRKEIIALRDVIDEQNVDEILRHFKSKIDKEIDAINQQLRKLSSHAKPELEASGGRVNFVRDMECLSCNQDCVMRQCEILVPKLKNAHSTPSIRPFITYELGSLRKSSQMGAITKVEKPPPPAAAAGEKPKCVCTRHAGGPHTLLSPAERVKALRAHK